LEQLEQDLAPHYIIGLDTAPFIYLWERHPRYFAFAETLFRHLGKPDRQGITSMITLIEVCVLPQRQGRQDLVQAYERALLHSLQVRMLPVDAVLARRTVALRAKHDIRVPDAVQIAAAMEAGCTAFVTNDQRLSKITELQVVQLDDYLH
jgi:predicted nucleic acid-binding protein